MEQTTQSDLTDNRIVRLLIYIILGAIAVILLSIALNMLVGFLFGLFFGLVKLVVLVGVIGLVLWVAYKILV